MTRRRPIAALLAFSWLMRDARVQRHARALGEVYDVRLVGYAVTDVAEIAGAKVHAVAFPRQSSAGRRMARGVLLATGRLAPGYAYERLYWDYELHRTAYESLLDIGPEVMLANDWQALPAVQRAASGLSVPFALDLHEHATEQYAERPLWRLFRRPMAAHMLRRYGHSADRVFTVNDALANVYRSDFGLDTSVILNAPERVALPASRPCRPDRVGIVHHGVAAPSRQLECMIEAVALAEPRFRLDLMLVPTDEAYVRKLAALAHRLAPDRVRVVPPVAPEAIVQTIGGYDLGVFVLPPANWQHAHCLPNKLFDFVVAGLGVVVGPSPEMANLVRQHGCGVASASFEPRDVATALNALGPSDIDRLKANARKASVVLNGEIEAEKLRTAIVGLGRANRTRVTA